MPRLFRFFSLLLLFPFVLSAKVFLNTTDPLHRADQEIRQENIELPRKIDSLIRLDKEEQREELRASRIEPDTTHLDPTLCLILWPERELLQQQLGVLAAFEERGRRPVRIVAAGWGGWLAALWLAGWSVDAIAAVADQDSLWYPPPLPPDSGRFEGWSVGGDPLNPERGGLGIWWGSQLNRRAKTESFQLEESSSLWGERELKRRALLRLRLMLGSTTEHRSWREQLTLLATRLDSFSLPVELDRALIDLKGSHRAPISPSLYEAVELTLRDPVSDPPLLLEQQLWGGVGHELRPWVESGLLFPGRERWFSPPSKQSGVSGAQQQLLWGAQRGAHRLREDAEYARIAPERGLLQLRIPFGQLDRESGRRSALELIDERIRMNGSEESMPLFVSEKRSAEQALRQRVTIELDSIDAQFQGFFQTRVLGGEESVDPVELRTRLSAASRSGLFNEIAVGLSPPGEPLYAQVYTKIGFPLQFGVGPYALWPAGALVWGRMGTSWVQQTLFSLTVDGWWGEWARGAAGEFALRSGSLSGFEAALRFHWSEFDYSGWDSAPEAVLEERASWLEFRVIHGRKFPMEIVVRFDNSFFWTGLSQASQEVLDYYDVLEDVLIQQGIGDLLVRPTSLVVDAQWRERRGLELGVEWKSRSPKRIPWKFHLGFASYGVEGWHSGVAPLFLRSALQWGRRTPLTPWSSLGFEGGAGIDLAMGQLLDGELRLPDPLKHNFDHSDPALDLATSQTMGAGLQTPLRRSDDQARGYARVGSDLRLGTKSLALKLGGGLVYRHLPSSAVEERELQQLLLAEIDGNFGPLQWRSGIEKRWRIAERESGRLTWNGPARDDFRWLVEFSTAPF